MKRFDATNNQELVAAIRHLKETGFAVLEGMLTNDELEGFSRSVASILQREREHPFDPGDGPASPDDESIETYLADS